MTTMKILIVVNIFDRYNNTKIKWAGIFQFITLTNVHPSRVYIFYIQMYFVKKILEWMS